MPRKTTPVQTLEPVITPDDERNLRAGIQALQEALMLWERCAKTGDPQAAAACAQCQKDLEVAEGYLREFFSPSGS